MNTHQKGRLSEAHVLRALLLVGYQVFIPFGEQHRIDFVIADQEGKLFKVQVKTAQLIERDRIIIRTANTTRKDGKLVTKSYVGDVDFIAAYCPDLDKCYLIPIEEDSPKYMLTLYVGDNPSGKRIPASMYELGLVG
ncbi:hypothetical protein KA005_28790 [bacterium]|nr:hypothetical protein [bacterium]